jgi:hypothetical protein
MMKAQLFIDILTEILEELQTTKLAGDINRGF